MDFIICASFSFRTTLFFMIFSAKITVLKSIILSDDDLSEVKSEAIRNGIPPVTAECVIEHIKLRVSWSETESMGEDETIQHIKQYYDEGKNICLFGGPIGAFSTIVAVILALIFLMQIFCCFIRKCRGKTTLITEQHQTVSSLFSFFSFYINFSSFFVGYAQ